MKIAIVGAGLSGSNVLRALMTHPKFQAEDEIDVFESRDVLGSGLPYHPSDDESIMLNISPAVMSVDLENANDFVEWLEENYEEPTNFEHLVSRPKYGRYLIERFAPFYQHEQVRHIQETVEDVQTFDAVTGEEVYQGTGRELVYRLKTNRGWQKARYDAVFFAIGHPAYNDFYHLKDKEHFIHNPYPMNEKLMTLDENARIAVLGSGATGVDIMRFLFINYDLKNPLTFYDVKEPFHSISIPYDKENFTYSISMDWIEEQKDQHDGFIPLQVILGTIQKDLRKEDADVMAVYNRYKADTFEVYRKASATKDQELAAVQKYASKTVRFLPHLYNALSGKDQDIYMDKYYNIMQFFKSRVPYLSYQWLFDSLDSGQLVAKNGLHNVQGLDNGRFKITTQEDQAEVDVLINATGFNNHLKSLAKDNPLIANLYDKRIILPHVNGRFILINWPECRVINQRFGVMKNLFFLGLLIGGTQHENNDAGQAIEQANFTAKAFMDKR